MTASTFTAEQMLEKAIHWLLDDGKIGPETANRLRGHCLPETDKQKALRLLQMYGCADILRLSADQVKLIRSVVERCPDDSAPSKPRLAVGQIWRRRNGAIVTVERFIGNNAPFYFVADDFTYTAEGQYRIGGRHALDLVEYVGQVNYTEPKSCEH